MVRGGCWYDDGRICRSACRAQGDPGYCGNDIGFRVVLAPAVESIALQITSSAQGVQLSWPLAGAGYGLQSRSSLAPSGAWVDWPAAPQPVNGRFVVTVPANGPALFFRLYEH